MITGAPLSVMALSEYAWLTSLLQVFHAVCPTATSYTTISDPGSAWSTVTDKSDSWNDEDTKISSLGECE